MIAKKRIPSRRKVVKKTALEREREKLYKCDEIKEEFCEYIREGLPPYHCCNLTGISHRHFLTMQKKVCDYLEKERLPDGVSQDCVEAWADFFEDVAKALANFQRDHIMHALHVTSKKEDRFMFSRSLQILERRDPTHWRLQKEVINTEKEYDKDESFL